jgi:aspartyl-tRNA(Asn)/glutamyl-tRNA(Gln) amidotransferase subunit A
MDPEGEGSRTFLEVYEHRAMAAARAADLRRGAGLSQGPLAGIPLSVKDAFDVAGSRTRAGSTVLADVRPAKQDSVAVARLRAAGAIIVGRTNMSEFAFTGLGLNPHYGSPRSPFERTRGRVAGGSSSGSAVSVCDGMALASIGTDTGGSGRIPAAFCGIVGYKPTRGRIPLDGVFPLAASFDTVSPMARSVRDCRLLASVLSAQIVPSAPCAADTIRLGLATGFPMDGLEAGVAEAFQEALAYLKARGIRIEPVQGIDWRLPSELMREGMITAVEALAAHGKLFERCDAYDPRVAERLEAGLAVPAHVYVSVLQRIVKLRQAISLPLAGFSAVIMPTVAVLPPLIEGLETSGGFMDANAKVLRNTMIANVLDLCAISLPISQPGKPPVGAMLMGAHGGDAALLNVAETVERLLTHRY